MIDFNKVRVQVRESEVAKSVQGSLFYFLDDDEKIAIARSRSGSLEIFFCGPALSAKIPKVTENLTYGQWEDESGRRFGANRVRFPHEPYFDSVVALICTEYLEALTLAPPNIAFGRVEELIALSLESSPPDSVRTAIGLAGELVLLSSLITKDPSHASRHIANWHGYAHSNRDFTIDECGVEVKTTTKNSSVHRVSGVKQIEVGHSVNDVFEAKLYLLSLGLVWLPPKTTNSYTVQGLVDSICHFLEPEQKAAFLRLVALYGDDPMHSYRHNNEGNDEIYTREFRVAFTRLYDLLDSRVHLLTSKTLAGLTHVKSDTVSFELQFPDKIRGDVNPRKELDEIVETLLDFGTHE